MVEERVDVETGGGVGMDGVPGVSSRIMDLNLPKSLTYEEKKYLLAVERGDMANVKKMLQLAHRKRQININCVDSLGRGALTLSIDGENLEMVELLVVMGVETNDALLQAINAEFVEAVELLLEHEELIHKEGEPYSWQKVDNNIAMFTPDMTPLILAAHKNNYEIIKILLDRGATLPMPHDIKCGCEECIKHSTEDSLRHSLSRINEYRALASPSLIALSSPDPLLTAFQLSWELRNLAFAEQECKSDYLDLRRQCQQFAVDLLHQSRSSAELAIILNHAPEEPPYEQGGHMKLARLELAINYKQKKFVAHPNIQQLLAAIWYEGVPGFRRKSNLEKILIILRVAILFPFYCMLYMLAPNCPTGKLMRKPFMKFLIHASAYLFFLLILILVSQRAEVQVIQLFGTQHMRKELEQELLKQRGTGPTYLEMLVVIYVVGFIWEETQEIFITGIRSYLRNMWNFIDFTRNSLYCAVVLLRTAAYFQQSSEIATDPSIKFIPREQWDAFDPQLIAEGLFAAANIFSALKLIHLFSIDPHLGPLQISLGRMVIDIVKFFFIYSLVLFAFACGLNQLLWYFAELEKRKCYVLPGGLPDWENASDSCMKWRSFGNVFEASQSLFWASFGMVGLENFELAGIKTYTRFWGLLMFGSYSVINVIVLLNLLIAMMSNSYAMIDEHSDVEWKFARTRLWMSYFEESATLPPPFNIMPTPKLFCKMLGVRKTDKLRRENSKNKKIAERDVVYTSVIRALVWRYVCVMHRKCDEDPVTEDDINEVKGDISAMRYELLEVLEKNGMDVSMTDRKEKMVLGKKMKIWERRLMKDFHVAPINLEEEEEGADVVAPLEGENSLARFRRIAKMAAATSSSAKWGELVKGVCTSSQIGRCRSRDSFKQQQNLQRAMQEAKKLALRSPMPGSSRSTTPVEMPASPGHNILELLKDIREEANDIDGQQPWTPQGAGQNMLAVQKPNGVASPSLSVKVSRTVTPSIPLKSAAPEVPQTHDSPPTSTSPTTSPPVISPILSPVMSPDRLSPEPTQSTSYIDETEASKSKDEPVPLGAVQRDSPLRVIKRKAPPVTSRAEGAIPPPPPVVRREPPQVEVTPVTPRRKERIVSPPPPILSSRPASPICERPVSAPLPEMATVTDQPPRPLTPPQPSTSAVFRPVTPPAPIPTPVTPPAPRPKTPTQLPPQNDENNAAIVPGPRLSSTSSKERLIPSPLRSPGPPSNIKGVTGVKRQPKTGWL